MSDSSHEIERLMYHYVKLFDTGELDAFCELFRHGTWHPAEPGADGLRRWIADHVLLYEGRPRTRHLISNLLIDVDEELDTAQARSAVTVFQALPDFPLQAIAVGRYADTFNRVEGRWRWLERKTAVDLWGDGSRHVRDFEPVV